MEASTATTSWLRNLHSQSWSLQREALVTAQSELVRVDEEASHLMMLRLSPVLLSLIASTTTRPALLLEACKTISVACSVLEEKFVISDAKRVAPHLIRLSVSASSVVVAQVCLDTYVSLYRHLPSLGLESLLSAAEHANLHMRRNCIFVLSLMMPSGDLRSAQQLQPFKNGILHLVKSSISSTDPETRANARICLFELFKLWPIDAQGVLDEMQETHAKQFRAEFPLPLVIETDTKGDSSSQEGKSQLPLKLGERFDAMKKALLKWKKEKLERKNQIRMQKLKISPSQNDSTILEGSPRSLSKLKFLQAREELVLSDNLRAELAKVEDADDAPLISPEMSSSSTETFKIDIVVDQAPPKAIELNEEPLQTIDKNSTNGRLRSLFLKIIILFLVIGFAVPFLWTFNATVFGYSNQRDSTGSGP